MVMIQMLLIVLDTVFPPCRAGFVGVRRGEGDVNFLYL